VIGPLVGGALAQAAGEQAAFGALVGCALAVGTWVLLLKPAEATRADEAASPATGR
jgi:predicted MFS family arabinose efflux permease